MVLVLLESILFNDLSWSKVTHKMHNKLSFHFVRSMISRGFIALNHLKLHNNLPDALTKHWYSPSTGVIITSRIYFDPYSITLGTLRLYTQTIQLGVWTSSSYGRIVWILWSPIEARSEDIQVDGEYQIVSKITGASNC